MRIAIFHDFFGTIGGGEKLVVELARGLKADIITTQKDERNLKLMKADDVNIISLGNPFPFPVLKQIIASWLFSRADFPDYDFYILSGNWAIFAAKKHKPNLLYCHTPVRMFYQAYDDFKKIAPWWAKPFFVLWVKVHRYFLEKNLKHIQGVVANSQDCKRRVKKYYHKDAVVINPPIKKYRFRKYGDFWLSVNRLYPHKRVELQLEAFRRLPKEKLLIAGGVSAGDHSERYRKELLRNKPKNVVFLGEVGEKKLEELYGDCRAFIATSQKEDFGMNIVEAMGAGKPVVAVNEGGHRETVVNGKTGFLVAADADSLVRAIKLLSKNNNKYKAYCIANANKYSVERFIGRMKHEIKAVKAVRADKNIGVD